MSSEAEILELMCCELPTLRQQVEMKLLREIYQQWPKAKKKELKSSQNKLELLEKLYFQFMSSIDQKLEEIEGVQIQLEEFQRHWKEADRDEDKEELLLRSSRMLGYQMQHLNEDKKALDRWFGDDALMDRYRKRVSFCIRELLILLEQVGKVLGFYLKERPEFWKKSKFEIYLEPYLTYIPDVRIRISSFKALVRAIQGLPEDRREKSLNEFSLRYVYRTAMASRQDVWLQISALELLPYLTIESLLKVAERRLTRFGDGDDIFFRHRVVQTIAPYAGKELDMLILLRLVVKDPSEHVRMALAENLHHIPKSYRSQFVIKMIKDTSFRVRAKIILNFGSWKLDEETIKLVVKLMQKITQKETHPFVLRVLYQEVVKIAELIYLKNSIQCFEFSRQVGEDLHSSFERQEDPMMRRYLNRSMLGLWVWSSSVRVECFRELKKMMWRQALGTWFRYKSPQSLSQDELMLILTYLNQEGQPLQIKLKNKGCRICQGQKFGFKWWRLVHELRHSSPDKRQGHSHTIGRIFRGDYFIPSATMGEMSETKVPGEPLMISAEGQWRPYLPLLDFVSDALTGNWFKSYYGIYSPSGITHVKLSWNPLRRILSVLTLIFNFQKIAVLRNWKKGMQQNSCEYLKALSRLGVYCDFEPHDFGFGKLEDKSISQFFHEAAKGEGAS